MSLCREDHEELAEKVAKLLDEALRLAIEMRGEGDGAETLVEQIDDAEWHARRYMEAVKAGLAKEKIAANPIRSVRGAFAQENGGAA